MRPVNHRLNSPAGRATFSEEFPMQAPMETGRGVLASLDLKCALIGAGMRYPEHVYEAIAGRARLEHPGNSFACNGVFLPGDVAVHLTANENFPYALDVDGDGQVALYPAQEHICEMTFPPATDYFQQTTTAEVR
jgi:hypothetical protein